MKKQLKGNYRFKPWLIDHSVMLRNELPEWSIICHGSCRYHKAYTRNYSVEAEKTITNSEKSSKYMLAFVESWKTVM